MRISFAGDEVALLLGECGTVAIAKTLGNYFYLEKETEEVVLFTEPEDLIVASSFQPGEKVIRGLKCTIYQIRELGSPLIVLPKGHPASPRLKTVVSIGPRTRLSCRIEPGTHPEQEVLCGSEEFHDLTISGSEEGAVVEGFQGRVRIDRL